VQRRFRLTSSADIKRVWRFGKSYAHPLIVLICHENNQVQPRIGIIAGKAIGNAVQRNRAKRLLRAAAQPILASLRPGWDFLLIARKPMLEARYSHVETALTQLLRRADLFLPVESDVVDQEAE
jgi:ribonuclease P protein component